MKSSLSHSSKANQLKRTQFAIGHLQGVSKMINEGRYCIDIINQVDAIQGSLKKLKTLILEDHLKGCVADAIKNGGPKARREAIDELLEVYKTNER